jgi:pilus assembly protein CpaD
MTLRKTPIVMGCIAALLASASLAGPRGERLPPLPTSEAPNPLNVTLLKLTHDVPFQGDTIGIEGRQQVDLDAFLASSEAQPGDPAYVQSDGSPLGAARAENLARQLADRGFATQVIRDTTTAAHSVRIVLERYVVTTPACPNWSAVSWANFENHSSSNFGCSTADDLAAMVANPRDLAVGRGLESAPSDAASLPVAKYRAGLAPALPGASSGGGGGGGGGGGAGP